MLPFAIDAVVGLFLFATTCTTLFQFVLLALCWKYWRSVGSGPAPAPPALSGEHPFVTIQLPMFNESAIAGRIIDAVADFDYPHDRMEIQVLDDSIDDSPRLLRAKIAELRESHPELRVTLLHRTDRSGFKAGALSAALPAARGEFIAVFDADFVPAPDFLTKTLPWFAAHDVAVVQSRWGHLNPRDSLITRFQEFFLDCHHSVEQRGRCDAGYFLTFNGTAGVWRRKAMEEVGGWNTDTLAEDLDLSFRVQVRGWRIQFLEQYPTPGELPNSILALRVQLFRWMKGNAQVGRKIFPSLLRAKLPLVVKANALFQVFATLSIVAGLFATVVSAVLPILIALSPESSRLLGFSIASYTWIPFVAILYGTPRLRFDSGPLIPRVVEFVFRMIWFLIVMAGLSTQGSIAVFQALFGGRGDWVVTPKGFTAAMGTATQRTQKRLPRYMWLDVPVALYLAFALGVAIWTGSLGLIVVMAFWLCGHLYLFGGSLWEISARPHAAPTSSTLLPSGVPSFETIPAIDSAVLPVDAKGIASSL